MTPSKGEIGYFGALRNYNFEGNMSSLAMSASNVYTNELALAIQRRPTTTNSSSDTEFLTCFLWNTSVAFNVRSVNGIGRIVSITQKPLNKFQPSFNVSTVTGNHISYAAYAWGLSDYLVGYIGWREDQIRLSFESDRGPILNSYLSTGSQFYNMSANMANMGQVETALQNPANVRRVSFKEDVEDFSLNASLSILNDPTLCTRTQVEVTLTEIFNMYTYKPKGLLIPYGVAIFCSIISACLGLFAFIESGVSYDTRVSTIGAAMQNSEVREALLSARISMAQPLHKQAGAIKLKFDPNEGFLVQRRGYNA